MATKKKTQKRSRGASHELAVLLIRICQPVIERSGVSKVNVLKAIEHAADSLTTLARYPHKGYDIEHSCWMDIPKSQASQLFALSDEAWSPDK